MFLPLRRARWPLHTKMGRICKVAVEMTRRINRGESKQDIRRRLETRTKRGFPHSTATATAGCLAATRPNPAKIGVSSRFLHRTEKGIQPQCKYRTMSESQCFRK